MITPTELLDFALHQVVRAEGGEVWARRAISAAYYALFHAVAHAGAALLSASPPVRHEFARAYDHNALAEAAKNVQKLPSLDSRLKVIAGSLVRLRESREKADYDLAATITWDEADELVQEALHAMNLLVEIRSTPDLAQFLLLAPFFRKRGRRG